VAKHTSVTNRSLKILDGWAEINGESVLIWCGAWFTATVDQQWPRGQSPEDTDWWHSWQGRSSWSLHAGLG
jgi:hypothetical protein